MPGISYTLGLDSKPALAGLSALQGALGSFAGGLGKLGPLIGLAGGLGAVGLAVGGFKKAITEAAHMEGFETGFKVLLGTAQAATERMRELAKFAADTPFDLPEIAAASRTLDTLTKGALSTGNGLTLVGDVASGTQQPFSELATWVGRLYDGLQSGRPVGEAMARMQELGVISGETRAKIEALQAAGKKGAEVWGVMEGSLGRFSGIMKEQSETWDGLMSTFKDGVNAVFREFGAPILPQLKPVLADGISLTDQLALTAHRWGENVGTAVGLLRDATGAGKFGELAGLSLKVGFGEAVAFLGQKINEMFQSVRADSGGLFTGLKDVFLGLGDVLAGAITKGVANSAKGLQIAGHGIFDADALRTAATAGHLQGVQGRQETQGGLQEMARGGGLGGQLSGFLTKLATDAPAAKAELQKLWDGQLAAIAGQKTQQAEDDKLFAAGRPRVNAAETIATIPSKVTPMSDRLAKIGGFIGGSGGVRGEKAQLDTARNTQEIHRAVMETNRLLQTPKKPAGATF